MVKQGFRNANSLALRLMNAVSSANGRRKRMEQFAAMRAVSGAYPSSQRFATVKNRSERFFMRAGYGYW